MTFRQRKEEHIYFIRGQFDALPKKFNHHPSGKKNAKYIFLMNENLFYLNLINSLPKNFKITTNDGSGQFNIILLEDTCPAISKFIKENPGATEYHIDVNDKDNIISKFEKLFNGGHISFTEDELPVCKKITSSLNLTNCPNYMKSENLKSEEVGDSNLTLESGLEIDRIKFKSFIKDYRNKKFKIATKSKEYECNYFAIFSSPLLRDFALNNPDNKPYDYDFADENNEFSEMCNFLNFLPAEVTLTNMDILKEIAEDLKIDYIIPEIDQYISEYENFTQKIDEQQNKVDLIEELFGWLYGIQSLTVETVKASILASNWITKEEEVIELAAFILQVINSSLSLHPFIIDLLAQLDKEADESNNLSILLPFIIKQLFFSFGESLSNCAFIYALYQRGILPKDQMTNNLKDIFNNRSKNRSTSEAIKNIQMWFLPELIELNIEIMINDKTKFIKAYYPDNIDLYKKMRDSFEPDHELTKSLRKDDVDKVQSIVSKSETDINRVYVPVNSFDDFLRDDRVKIIDYAAAFGSIKCFKYLLLNHSEVDYTTFHYAIYGGNTEIIQIVDQKTSSNKKPSYQKIKLFLLPAISRHKNDLFDWIVEQKIPHEMLKTVDLILALSATYGNAHAFIEIADKYIANYDYPEFIHTASSKGFYKLASLIFDISNKSNDSKQSKNSDNFTNKYTIFGNLSIFKFGIEISNSSKIDRLVESIYICIEKDYQSIYNYCFDEIFKNDTSCLTESLFMRIADKAIGGKLNYYFVHLIDQIKQIKPSFLEKFEKYGNLLTTACEKANIDIIKIILDLIKESKSDTDITPSFISAAKNGSIEICQYLINEKYFNIDNQSFFNDIDSIGKLNKDIFTLILDNSTPELRESFYQCALIPAINNRNKDLIKLLLDNNVSNIDMLNKAISTNDNDIVEIILSYNSTPSLINQKSASGTPLYAAVNRNDLQLVKRLLSIPGIDPNLYENNDKTPLISSIVNFNLDIMNEILNFYGEDIQKQAWQLDTAIRITLGMLSSNSKNNNSNRTFGSRQERAPKNKEDQKISEQKMKLLKILNRILQIKNIDPNLHGGEHTLLSYACETNEVNIVQMLLETDKIDVNAYAPKNGNTPLMISIFNNNLEIADLLIKDKRTNINARNYNNETALVLAVRERLDDIVTKLIKNEKFDPHESCLDYAFYISSSPISNILFTNQAFDINYKTKNYNEKSRLKNTIDRSIYDTPLTDAVRSNDIEKVKLIIQHPSFDKVKSLFTRSIFIAASGNQTKIFKILIKLIDNDVNISNYSKTTLLGISIYCSSIDIVDEIINNEKFDTEKNDISYYFTKALLNNNHFSPDIANHILEFDSKKTHKIDFNKLLPNGETFYTSLDLRNSIRARVSYLLEHEADPNIPNEKGVYPLAFAIINNNSNYVASLLESGKVDLTKHINQILNIYQRYKIELPAKYTTFLHLAAQSTDDIFNLFLGLDSIDINSLDENGNTPLMYAVANRRVENINILFAFTKQEVDYLHVNNDGKNALTIIENSDETQQNFQNKNEFRAAIFDRLRNKKAKSENNKKTENDADSKGKEADGKKDEAENATNSTEKKENTTNSDENKQSSSPSENSQSTKTNELKIENKKESDDSKSDDKLPPKASVGDKATGFKFGHKQGENSSESDKKSLTLPKKQFAGIKANQEQGENSSESDKKSSPLPKKQFTGFKANSKQGENEPDSTEESPSSVQPKASIGFKLNSKKEENTPESEEKPTSLPKKHLTEFKLSNKREENESDSKEKSPSSIQPKASIEGGKRIGFKVNSKQEQNASEPTSKFTQNNKQSERGSDSKEKSPGAFAIKGSLGSKQRPDNSSNKVNSFSFKKKSPTSQDESNSTSSEDTFAAKENDKNDEGTKKSFGMKEETDEKEEQSSSSTQNDDVASSATATAASSAFSNPPRFSVNQLQDEIIDPLAALGSQGREISRQLNSGLEQEVESEIGGLLANASPDVLKAITKTIYKITSKRLKSAAMSLPNNNDDDNDIVPFDYQNQMMQQQWQQLMQINYNSQYQFNMYMQQMQAIQMFNTQHQSKKKKNTKRKK